MWESNAFWGAVVGLVTGLGAYVTGRKSKAEREIDHGARIGDAWGDFATAVKADNQELRLRVEELEDEAHECLRRYDRLERYLRQLGLEIPPDFT